MFGALPQQYGRVACWSPHLGSNLNRGVNFLQLMCNWCAMRCGDKQHELRCVQHCDNSLVELHASHAMEKSQHGAAMHRCQGKSHII